MNGYISFWNTGILASLPALGTFVAIFQHLLVHRVSEAFASHFLVIWFCSLCLFIAYGLSRRGAGDPVFPPASGREDSGFNHGLLSNWRLADKLSLVLLLFFTGFYIFVIFYQETFAYYDDDMLTDFSLRGINFPPPIWPGRGRFFPLAVQEFNALKFITRSPFGYHCLVVIQLVVLLAVLFVFLREFQIRYRALLLITVMVTPSFLIPFSGFVYPERNVLFWLVILLLCLQRHLRGGSRIYFVGTLVAVHFALYYKEPVVLIVAAYALTQLFISIRPARGPSRSWRKLLGENSLPVGLLAVCGVYVLCFVLVIHAHVSTSYIAEHQQSLPSALLAYFRLDWLPWILLGVVLVRLARALWFGAELDAKWDAWAIGALAYVCAVLALRLESGYYLAPADFIALLYLAHVSLVWLSKPSPIRKWAVAITFACVFVQGVTFSAFRTIERKSLLIGEKQLADFIADYASTARNHSVELFFPYTSNYRLMGFSSYLKYRGFQFSGENGQPGRGRLVVEGQGLFQNNRCVGYRDYSCIHKESAGAGGLIVVPPDDDVTIADEERAGRGSILLLSSNPCASCGNPNSWLRRLHAVSAEFATRPLPEHWMQLDVFKRPD